MAFCRCRLGLWHFPFCFCFVGRKLARSTFFPHFVRAFSILGRTKVYELITEIEWTNQKARNALSEVENLIITNNPSYLEYVTEGHLVTLPLRFCSSLWRDSPLRLPRGGGGGEVSPRKSVVQSACQYDVTSRVSDFQNGEQSVHRRDG